MTASPATTAVAAACHNNLIAESDLAAALQAADDRLLRVMAQHPTNTLLEPCRVSLARNIQRIVQPVTDEAFHVYKSQQTKSQTAAAVANGSTEHSTATAPQEIDEADLLDRVALERVQALRETVRLQAAQVNQLQCQVTDQAVDVAARQVQLWVGRNNNAADNDANEENSTIEILATDADTVQQMQASLKNMQTALHQTDRNLPVKLASLQQTIHTVETNLQKSSMSQTEQAIRSREFASGAAASGEQTNAIVAKDPAARLANFLRRDE